MFNPVLRRAALVMLTTGMGWTLVGCEAEPPAEVAEVPRPVKTMLIELPETRRVRNFPAQVEAAHRADLSFRVPGSLQEVLVKEGQKVEQGEVLAKLDAKDYQIIVNDRQASYNRAQSEYQRGKELVEPGYISRTDFDKLESGFKSARAALDAARNDLKYTQLKAPFSGNIAKRLVENFEEVQAKEPIFELRALDILELKFAVPENIVRMVRNQRVDTDEVRRRAAQRVYATFEGIEDQHFDLVFKEAATEADPQTRTFEATFTMNRPPELHILPGMTATVTVDLEAITDRQDTPVFQIPANAVVATNKLGSRVWVVDEATMTLKAKDVEVGKMLGTNIEVKTGIEAGDRVVTAGTAYMVEGKKVTLMATPEQAEPRQDDVTSNTHSAN